MRNYGAYDLEKVGDLTEDQMQLFVAMQNVEQEEANEQSKGWRGNRQMSMKGKFAGKHGMNKF